MASDIRIITLVIHNDQTDSPTFFICLEPCLKDLKDCTSPYYIQTSSLVFAAAFAQIIVGVVNPQLKHPACSLKAQAFSHFQMPIKLLVAASKCDTGLAIVVQSQTTQSLKATGIFPQFAAAELQAMQLDS